MKPGFLLRALALLTALTCAGCVQFNKQDFVRQVPADCEHLAQDVPLPIVTKGTDVRRSLAEHRAALVEANGNLDATRTCEARVRADFDK